MKPLHVAIFLFLFTTMQARTPSFVPPVYNYTSTTYNADNQNWAIAQGKLYNSWLVYDDHQLIMRSLTTDQQYYLTIEAFNENGISEQSTPIHVK